MSAIPKKTEMPHKPPMGEACNGCGLCCRLEVCEMGVQAMGKLATLPCPALVERDGRTWCAIIEACDEEHPAFGDYMKWRLGIGAGCQVHDDFAEPPQ